jgi:hypothetical protein
VAAIAADVNDLAFAADDIQAEDSLPLDQAVAEVTLIHCSHEQRRIA